MIAIGRSRASSARPSDTDSGTRASSGRATIGASVPSKSKASRGRRRMTACSARSPSGVNRCFICSSVHSSASCPASAMTSNAASLDLALIGNCAISALVDKRGAIVWCCAPRFDGDPIFHSLLGSARRRAAGRRVRRRAGRLRALGAGLRPEHRGRSHAAFRRRGRGHRNRRFLPALPQPRPLLQAGPDRASGAAAGRPPAGSLHRPSARAMGHGGARDHARQQSSALHPAGRRPAAEHQCAPDLRARQHLVLAAGLR